MLLQRILTALVLAPIAVALVAFAPTPWFALAVALVFLGAQWEWAALSGVRGTGLRVAVLVVAAAVFGALWLARATPATAWVLAGGICWWIAATVWLRHHAYGAAPTRAHVLLKLVAGLLVMVPAWAALVAVHARAPHGQWWTLVALCIVWAADIGAYSSGRTFGGRKLAPHVSPGKTWAGAYGALAAGVVVMAGGAWILGVRDARLAGFLVLALLTVAVSIVGDLTESLMKRHANVKDSGTLFPGHGGLLDRLDSVFAAMPLFALGLWWLDPAQAGA